jgi:hypothetical protein
MITKNDVDYVGIGMVIGALIGAFVMGAYMANIPPDCEHEYNKGYGDAIQFTLEHQRMSMYQSYSTNYSSSGISINGSPASCYENETGHDPSDLVMHVDCRDDVYAR